MSSDLLKIYLCYCLHIFDIQHLWDIWLQIVDFTICVIFFTVLVVILFRKTFNFKEMQFMYLVYLTSAFGTVSQILLPNPRSWKSTSVFLLTALLLYLFYPSLLSIQSLRFAYRVRQGLTSFSCMWMSSHRCILY